MSYLSDFEEINGGYIVFGGNPKGGKITSKDTECIVLSSDFKLPNDNHVLLRVPRENNMYNVDLKNIVPSEDLTYFFAKATLDESNLLHRRLGHINFKTLNKLVKDPQNTNDDTTFEVKEPESEVHVSPSSSAKTKKHDDKTKREAKGKSPVELSTKIRNLREEFEDFSDKQYVLFPLWSFGSKDPQNTDDDTTFEVKEPESEVHVSPSNSAKTKKHDDKTKREAKGKSLVEFTSVLAVGQSSTNNTNTFSAAGPSNTNVSPTLGKSSYVDPSQYPDDLDMPDLEDITYSDDEEDVGEEAEFSN
uniref:GAG-pre-integrase domain-containing protein n=1 Tax=Tanacetum cinerariifolium TaxID=118510 RepID=A0A6L2K563_TANCI|nr:hypothetical protein [Tanacetum cinerariifolium]